MEVRPVFTFTRYALAGARQHPVRDIGQQVVNLPEQGVRVALTVNQIFDTRNKQGLRVIPKQPHPSSNSNTNPRCAHVSGLIDQQVVPSIYPVNHFCYCSILDRPSNKRNMLGFSRNLPAVFVYNFDVVCPRKQVDPQQWGCFTHLHYLLLLRLIRPRCLKNILSK